MPGESDGLKATDNGPIFLKATNNHNGQRTNISVPESYRQPTTDNGPILLK